MRLNRVSTVEFEDLKLAVRLNFGGLISIVEKVSAAANSDSQTEVLRAMADCLQEITVGAEGLQDEDGNPVAWGERSAYELEPYVVKALYEKVLNIGQQPRPEDPLAVSTPPQ